MAIESLGRALVHRNYRLFLLGQGISLIGTWMQQVAMAWLLYRLTASPFLLGLMSFSSQIPNLILSPLAGVGADRWNRHRALLVTQSLAMIQAILVLIVVNSGGDFIWLLIGLGLFSGVINSFDVPIRQSFLIEMVPDRDHLSNAIALNSSIVNGARLIGPALAGIVIATWNESVCFLLNAISYFAVLVALLCMRNLAVQKVEQHGNFLARLREGLTYAFGFAPLRSILLLLALVSFLSTSTSVLMPVYTKEILQGTANTQGLLMSSMGVGALASALYLASRKSVLGLGRIIALASGLYGVGQVAFSYSSYLWISVPILAINGFCMMLHMASSNTLIQTIVESDKRGRVMSLYSMAFLGVAPIGSLVAGILASRVGPQLTVRIAGVICIAAALVFNWQLPQMRHLVRPIYEEAGILPKSIDPANET